MSLRRQFRTPCSLGLSATSQPYFSLTTHQPPATSQQYSSLRTNQHQPSVVVRGFLFALIRQRAADFFFFLPWVPSGSLGALLQLLFFSFPFSF
jgi:hypothetical protein